MHILFNFSLKNKLSVNYLYVTNFHIYLIITKKLKDCSIINQYEIPFSKLEENVDGLPLTEHGAILNYLAFSSYTAASRRNAYIHHHVALL